MMFECRWWAGADADRVPRMTGRSRRASTADGPAPPRPPSAARGGRSRSPVSWVVPVLFLAAACTEEAVVPDRVLSGEPSCQACEIRIADRVVLGSMDDSVSPSGRSQVILGEDGGFFLISEQLSLPGVLRYGPDGSFRGVLGRQGQGPGEMGRPWRLGGTSGGVLYVFDALLSAVHVFGPDGEWERTLRPVVNPIQGPVPVGDSVMALVAASTGPSAAAGHDVVLYDARSGELLGGMGPERPPEAGRTRVVTSLAPARDGALWLGQGSLGVLERWTLSGERTSLLEWAEGWPRFARPDGGTGAFLGGHLWEDPGSGLLWVVSSSPNPSYVASPEDTVLPGQPLPVGFLDPAALNNRHRTIVTVVDPDRGQVLAHRMLDAYVHAVLLDGRLVVMDEAESGYQWAEVLRLELVGLPAR